MNLKQKQILRALQSDFPAAKNPFRVLAKRLAVSEPALLSQIRALKKQKIIRRIGAVLSGRHLGYSSVLVAARVQDKFVRKIAALVSRSENVSHNYLRDAEYNLWFTYSAPRKKAINDFICRLRKENGVESLITLPAEKTFKINAEFNF